jgi:Hint domain
MNKFPLFLITLGLIVSACSTGAEAPTNAPAGVAAATGVAGNSIPSTGEPPAGTPAITQQVGALVLGTPAPTTGGQGVATVGGAVVITVEPANGTPPAAGATAPARVATPIPTLAAGLKPTELKFRVLAAYPDMFYCDPDLYPVAVGDEAQLAEQRFPTLQANQEEFQAILAHNNLSGPDFSADQKLVIYRAHKKLAAIRFTLMGDKYQFQLATKDASGKGLLITGLIDGQGTISAQQSQPTFATCPICLAAQTKIDTPRGPVVVTDLRAGDLVWTVDASGARVAAPILQTVRVPVPATHQMVHLRLADGRELWASPGHPTSDGRWLGDLAAGGLLDGARIESAERVLYGQPATYDLLPASATGFYWANGILIGSTLK